MLNSAFTSFHLYYYLYYEALFNHKYNVLLLHLLKKAPLFIFIKNRLILIQKKD